MRKLPLDAQLDIDAPRELWPDIVFEWFDVVSQRIAPDHRRSIADQSAEPKGSKVRFGPFGVPGEPFGIVDVCRWSKQTQTSKSAERNYSRLGMDWFRQELQDLPTKASLWFGNLDELGHRSGGVLSLTALSRRPNGWLRLHAHPSEDKLLEAPDCLATQQAWLDLVRDFADRFDAAFGHIAYYYGNGETELEESFYREPQTMREARFTILNARATLRGYSWVTIVPRELMAKVGGVEGLTSSRAFHRVEPLPGGGALLVATADYRDYQGDAVGLVFRALAPILPHGMPMPWPPYIPDKPPERIVFEDAGAIHSG